MTSLGDTLTVGLILVLLFGSIALYLYTRIQQTEQKVSLLESIVLDLKLTGELPAFGEFPSASSLSSASASSLSSVSPPFPAAPSSSSPAAPSSSSPSSPQSRPSEQEYKPFLEEEEEGEPTFLGLEEVENVENVGGNLTHVVEEEIAVHPLPEESPYDTMSVKELQTAVRARGLSSEKGAKKQALIDLLKRSDQVSASEAKLDDARSSTFLETSSTLLSPEDAE